MAGGYNPPTLGDSEPLLGGGGDDDAAALGVGEPLLPPETKAPPAAPAPVPPPPVPHVTREASPAVPGGGPAPPSAGAPPLPPGGTSFMHIPDLPDAVASFEGMKPMLRWYMTYSIFSILCSIFIGAFLFALLSGILGIIAASMHLCECCRSTHSISGSVGAIRALAITSTVFSSLTGIILAAIFVLVLPKDDVGGEFFLVTLVVFYLGHAYAGVQIARRANIVKRLLSPVTAGVVVL